MGEETVLAEGESEDVTHSFLSDVSSELDEPGLETEEAADTGSEVDDGETDPADIPLPSTPPVVTSSLSTMPKAELPEISVSLSPSPSPSFASVSRISPTREHGPQSEKGIPPLLLPFQSRLLWQAAHSLHPLS